MRLRQYLIQNGWLMLVIASISACQQSIEAPSSNGLNKFSDPVIAQIYDYQDKRDSKALLGFFDDENPTYRKESALAFASVQDTVAVRPLGFLLNDPDTQVRVAVAYALGQMYDEQAIEPIYKALQIEDSLAVRKELIEALGKVITMPKIQLLQEIRIESDKEKEGLAWGLYRSGVRNVHDGINLDIALTLLDQNNTYDTRLGAAHFFSRSPNLAITGREDVIIKSATTDPSPNVRMAATLALRKAVTPKALSALVDVISEDKDYRVRVSAVRTLGSFQYDQIRDVLSEMLNDENVNVAIAAAQLMANKGAIEKSLVSESSNWRVKAILIGGIAETDRFSFIQSEYAKSTNPYYKAALLRAVGGTLEAKDFIVDQIFSDSNKVVTTAGTEALINIRRSDDFPDASKKEFAELFKRIIIQGDIAQVALISGIYLDPQLDFRSAYSDYSFLNNTKAKLSLPKDNEGLQVLNNVIAFFKGKEELPKTENEYNHPIDWEKVKAVAKDQKVKVKTSRGEFILRMLIEEAPGSALNFIELAKSGYFNGKNFHRIVPNFVIQGGCNRGDGYGGEDYSIRSEFANIRYQEGSVGMASAGKDTEGTQWFVTHSPTPHLDGRYTIFAQVEDGMDVVHNMEVGDVIEEVVVL